jgi:hypothetical protein
MIPAVARPIPAAAAVMSATFPSKRIVDLLLRLRLAQAAAGSGCGWLRLRLAQAAAGSGP